MFIGRKKELSQINSLLSEKSGCMMIYGKRKIGKTTLITHALKGRNNTAYYECIKDSLKANVDGLVNVLLREKIIPARIEFASFTDLFQYLNSLNGTFNIVIDEYPYLKVINKPEIDFCGGEEQQLKEYRDIKAKCKEAALDNIFAAIASYINNK